MAVDWNKIFPDLIKSVPALLGALAAVATQLKSLPPAGRMFLAALAFLLFLIWSLLALKAYSAVGVKMVAIFLLIVSPPGLLFFSAAAGVLFFSAPPEGDGKVIWRASNSFVIKGKAGTAQADEPKYQLKFDREAAYVKVIFVPAAEDKTHVSEVQFLSAGDVSDKDRITQTDDNTFVILEPSPLFVVPFDLHIELKEKADEPSVRMLVFYEYGERDAWWRLVRWTFKTFSNG